MSQEIVTGTVTMTARGPVLRRTGSFMAPAPESVPHAMRGAPSGFWQHLEPEPADRRIIQWMPTDYMEAARAGEGKPDALEVAFAEGYIKPDEFEMFWAKHVEACASTLDALPEIDLVRAEGCPLCGGSARVGREACGCTGLLDVARGDGFRVGDVVDVAPDPFAAFRPRWVAEWAAMMGPIPEPEPEDSTWLVTPADLRETRGGKGLGSGEQCGWGGYEDE